MYGKRIGLWIGIQYLVYGYIILPNIYEGSGRKRADKLPAYGIESSR
jgi:hypothetical protein